jgi:hypothetical protein
MTHPQEKEKKREIKKKEEVIKKENQKERWDKPAPGRLHKA